MDTLPPRQTWPLPAPAARELLDQHPRSHARAQARLTADYAEGRMAMLELGLMRQFVAQLTLAMGGEIRLSAAEWQAARQLIGSLEVVADDEGGICIRASQIQPPSS